MSVSADSSEPGRRLAAHGPRLRLLVQHLAGPAIRARVEPDDLVQEVFVRALTAPGGLPAAGADGNEMELWRFLAAIARHTVVDVARALRAARRDGRVESLARSEWSRAGRADPAALGAGPATRAVFAEVDDAVRRAFATLAPDHRRVIGLRQLEGLPAAEVARRMGRSESAVHSLYRRALEAWVGALPPGHRSSLPS